MNNKQVSTKQYALMQPTLMPWLGWFALMDYVDEFVIFDNAQFSYQSWHHRNSIKTTSGPLLITIPVSRKGGPFSLKEIRLADTHKVKKKLLASISQSYSKAPYFSTYFRGFEAILDKGLQSNSLFELNYQIINWGREMLGITTSLLFSSELNVSGIRGEYVANVGKFLHSKHYISPLGAKEYLAEDRSYFDMNNIEIEFLDYEHPVYNQVNGNFESHCCFLDLLFNEGPHSLDIIRSGVGNK